MLEETPISGGIPWRAGLDCEIEEFGVVGTREGEGEECSRLSILV